MRKFWDQFCVCSKLKADSYDADRTRLGMRRSIHEHLNRYPFKTHDVALALCQWIIFKEISQFEKLCHTCQQLEHLNDFVHIEQQLSFLPIRTLTNLLSDKSSKKHNILNSSSGLMCSWFSGKITAVIIHYQHCHI